MSQYYGDIQLGDTIDWLFTTVNTTPIPTILTGSPTATAYTDGGVTQSATGVTINADFDGVTGLNQIIVVASSGNGFAAGENIEIVIDAGTVGGNTVVGYAIGCFSIENRSNLRPTTVGNNEVDVTATGAVGIDWANVEGQGTTVDLSATDIQLVDTCTVNTDVRGTDSAALATALTTAQNDLDILTGSDGVNLLSTTQTSITNIEADTNELQGDWVNTGRLDNILDARMAEASIDTTGGAIDLVTTTTTATTATNLTNAPTSGDLTATMKTSVTTAADASITTTAYVETAQGLPAATASIEAKISFIYKCLRNRKTATATLINIYDDDATTIGQKRTISDDGTTYDELEIESGA